MPSCDPSTLAVARAGDLLARNVARINEWNAAGYTVRNRDQFRYVIEEVTLGPSGTQATALVCIADGSELVKPGAGPGGADVIIDDTFTVRARVLGHASGCRRQVACLRRAGGRPDGSEGRMSRRLTARRRSSRFSWRSASARRRLRLPGRRWRSGQRRPDG